MHACASVKLCVRVRPCRYAAGHRMCLWLPWEPIVSLTETSFPESYNCCRHNTLVSRSSSLRYCACKHIGMHHLFVILVTLRGAETSSVVLNFVLSRWPHCPALVTALEALLLPFWQVGLDPSYIVASFFLISSYISKRKCFSIGVIINLIQPFFNETVGPLCNVLRK